MASDDRMQLLAKWNTGMTDADGFVTAPGSAATITIWDSGSTVNAGTRYKLLVMTNTPSHDSGASGVSFQVSSDNGLNWDTYITYTDTAAGSPNVHWVALAAPRMRVRYTNSANVLTTWRGNLMADEYERAQ